jgi:dienelactone hydrolase
MRFLRLRRTRTARSAGSSRASTTDAALRLLAARDEVLDDAIALLGFSNGASTAALYVHHRLSDALVELADDPEWQSLDVAIPALPGPVPVLRRSIAYYPGCGFNGVLPFSVDPADVDAFYYPSVPLRVLHASEDSILDHCSVLGTGTREIQAREFAESNELPDHYDITVYEGADHGFDAAGCELPEAGSDPDTVACRDALAVTLELLEPLVVF